MSLLLSNNVPSTVVGENTKANEIEILLNQTQAHSSRTKEYSVATTADILKMLEEAGFTWKMVARERSSKKYKGFGTHLISCEHPDLNLGSDELNRELKPQLYIKNSYHGRTKLELHIGLFRFFCLNGLILGDKFKTIKMKHRWVTKEEFQAIAVEMKREFIEEVAPFVLKLKARKMSPAEQAEFADAALRERLRNVDGFLAADSSPLLESNRVEDNGDSAWVVLQRVQENLGLNFGSVPTELKFEKTAKDKDGNEITKERKVKRLSNIAEITYLNKFLFDRITDYLEE